MGFESPTILRNWSSNAIMSEIYDEKLSLVSLFVLAREVQPDGKKDEDPLFMI